MFSTNSVKFAAVLRKITFLKNSRWRPRWRTCCENLPEVGSAQPVSIYKNMVYELITKIESANQNARNTTSEVENLIIPNNQVEQLGVTSKVWPLSTIKQRFSLPHLNHHICL